jgi:hypothetical protein
MANLGSDWGSVGELSVESCEYLVYAVILVLSGLMLLTLLFCIDFVRLRTGRSSAV